MGSKRLLMGPFGWDRLGLNNAQTVPGGLNHTWACMAKLALWGLKQNFFFDLRCNTTEESATQICIRVFGGLNVRKNV